MTESIQIENGLTSLREAYFHMERAFFALNSTTHMSKESKSRAAELLVEMEEMMRSIWRMV